MPFSAINSGGISSSWPSTSPREPNEDAFGRSPNDPDPRNFANGSQNFPELQQTVFALGARSGGVAVGIKAELKNTIPDADYIIQFYKAADDPAEGLTLLHTRKKRIDALNPTTFTSAFVVPRGVIDEQGGDHITATVTRKINESGATFFETSEFSPSKFVTNGGNASGNDFPPGFKPDSGENDELGFNIAQILAQNAAFDNVLVKIEAPVGQELQEVRTVALPADVANGLEDFPEVKPVLNTAIGFNAPVANNGDRLKV